MSTYVVSLAGFVPGERFDGKPWTKALIEESTEQAGTYTLIETVTLTPVDSDPTQPQARNFTTTKAVHATGWFRVTFEDAEAHLQVSAAVFSSAQGSASLCGIGDVKQLLSKKSTDTTQDTLIESLIPRASIAVMRETDREFAPASTGLTRTFEFAWESQMVSLAPYDLRGLPSKVVVDTDQEPAGYELSANEWRVWPQPPKDGTYLSLRLQPFSMVAGPIAWPTRQVQVTGNWGFASIPGDVTHATALTVVHWLTVNTGAFRRPDDDPTISHVPRRGIPPEAWDLLNRFRRAI